MLRNCNEELEAVSEWVDGVEATDPRKLVGPLDWVACVGEAGGEGVERVGGGVQGGVGLAGRDEGVLDADVQRLAAAGEPDAAAGLERGRLLELGQTEEVAVEGSGGGLATRRGGDLDMVEAGDRHRAHDAGVRGWERRLRELAEEHDLYEEAVGRLRALLVLLAAEEHAPTPIREPAQAVDAHVADSLSGLAAVGEARSLADLGAGAGFPGLVLAAVRSGARVILLESVGRKAAWLGHATAMLDMGNVEVRAERVESWRPEARIDVVTARAVAPLPVLVEYAAPLLAPGGRLVAWKGDPDPAEEADGRAAAAALGLEESAVVPVQPFPGVRDRRLYVYAKVAQTPPGYPRRPGMAAKRPLRAEPDA